MCACMYICTAAQTTSLLFVLPLLAPQLFRTEAAFSHSGELGRLVQLGWSLIQFVRYAHMSHLSVADVSKVKELGGKCMQLLRSAVPDDLRNKPKWHYAFVHFHEMLLRCVSYMCASMYSVLYACIGFVNFVPLYMQARSGSLLVMLGVRGVARHIETRRASDKQQPWCAKTSC